MKNNNKSKVVTFLLVAITASAVIRVAAACMNETASNENRIKSCCECARMRNAKENSSCSFSRTDEGVPAYCECQARRNCKVTGNRIQWMVSGHTGGTCPANGCILGCQGATAQPAVPADIFEKEGSPCS